MADTAKKVSGDTYDVTVTIAEGGKIKDRVSLSGVLVAISSLEEREKTGEFVYKLKCAQRDAIQKKTSKKATEKAEANAEEIKKGG